MFINLISFKNGKTVSFQTKTPYSVDKVADGWNVITDESDGQAISFRGSEIVTIASQKAEKVGGLKQRRGAVTPGGKKAPAIRTSVTTEEGK